ncbi:MAG: fibronectin type III domain-containing protein, partial [bacterium]
GSNLNGIGARLTAWLQGRPQTQAVIAGQGYLGTGSDLTVHFGLGSSSQLDSLIVQWPSGARDRLHHLAANQKLTLYEGSAPPRDTSPPQISAVSTNNVTTTAATIKWKTDENADSQVEYGRDTNYGNFSARDGNFVTSHAMTLSNLAANTTYHFRVHSRDAAGNLALSNDFTFTTVRDTQGPGISNIATTAITATSAHVMWNTDELSSTRVEYGPDSTSLSGLVVDTDLALTHAAMLANLQPYTRYYFHVVAKDEAGNTTTSRKHSFMTLSAVDRLVVFNGNAQTRNPGEILTTPLAAKIENSAGVAMPNVQVEFRVIAGGGRVSGSPSCDSAVCVVASGQNGIASVKWRLGLADSQKVRVTVLEKPELAVIFTAKLKGPVNAVDEQVVSLPSAFALRNYPNPFHDFTRLEVALPSSGVISLKIFDLHGRAVITLAEEWRNAGRHFFAWKGKTDKGELLTSGIYFAVLRYQNQSAPRFAEKPASPIIVETQKIFYIK